MNIIIVSKQHGKAKSFVLGHKFILASLVILFSLIIGMLYVVYSSVLQNNEIFQSKNFVKTWQLELAHKGQELEEIRLKTDEQVNTLAVRVAQLQARLIRLDALGEHLVQSNKLDKGEFNFSRAPALGGPSNIDANHQYQPLNFIETIDELAIQIELREQELDVLSLLIGAKDFNNDSYIAGRPINKGWLSSRYGKRIDPFTGKLAWHQGIDFAGKENSDIISVAAGVVTWSGKRSGYGEMIEINHGGEYATRYAHANKLLVEVGDVVAKGQVVAYMGSSGRSTGPHVHFEVLKNNKQVNPASYIRRINK